MATTRKQIAIYFNFLTIQLGKAISNKNQKHTLSKCDQCYRQFSTLQGAYSVKPLYVSEPDPLDTVIEPAIKKIKLQMEETPEQTRARFGQAILNELDPICNEACGVPLNKMLSETPNAQLKIKSTHANIKKQSRETMSNVRCKLEQ